MRGSLVDSSVRVSAKQAQIVRAVVSWYVTTHYGTPDDRGVTQNFCDPKRVGAFAVSARSVAIRDPEHLFRLLVAVAMFQRRQDVQILRILQGMTASDVEEVSSIPALLAQADACRCSHASRLEQLLQRCDLTKTPRTKRGTCRAEPRIDCYLKRHTVLLRRYGHFGKVPTSLALAVRESGAANVTELLARVEARVADPHARARAMLEALSRAWRVNEKIASMFLSMVWNPDITPGVSPRDDLDWRHFIVIDSNTDAFLREIGYSGNGTYEARRRFLRAIAASVPLDELRPGLQRDNPRLVQQAMYLFMSGTNRRSLPGDCMHSRPGVCAACPSDLRKICPVREAPLRRRLPVAT